MEQPMSRTRQACAFAALFTRVEMTMILTRPWTRAAGLLHWLLVALVTANLAVFLPWPNPAVAVSASLALALTLTTALVSLLLLLGERTAFLRAVDTWYIRDDQGERGAYLRRDPRHSEHLTLCSVAATPRGHGLGDQLLTAILAHTDAPLRLWAVNRRVAHW